jgi:hypothetical protein
MFIEYIVCAKHCAKFRKTERMCQNIGDQELKWRQEWRRRKLPSLQE